MSGTSSIEFTIKNNTNGESVIYVTQDPAHNLLTYTFTYTGDDTITLKGGVPVAENDITPSGPTSLYFTISSVLTPKEFAAMEVKPPAGWQVANFTSWVLTPIADIIVKTDDSFSFSLSNITADNSPGPGTFNIDYYNISPVNDSGIQLNLSLEQLPSTHKNLKDVLDLSFVDGNTVFINVDDKDDIPANTLIIRLNNSSTSPLVPPKTPEKKSPVFYLMFVTATSSPGYGALSTIDRVKDFSVSLYKDYGTDWDIQNRTQQDPPHWAIYPKSPEILGVGADAIVEFKIENIVTDFAPSSTNLYLLSSYIPGYDDGSQVLAIEKKTPELAIQDLAATPESVASGNTVKLTWHTFAADACTLSPVDGGEISVPIQETKGYAVHPKRTTTYTLTAHNNSLGTKVSSQITAVVDNVTITQPLAAKPASGFHYGDPVSLSWTTYSADSCTISPPINGSTQVPLSSTATVIHPTAYRQYILTANGQGGPVTSELNVIPIPNGWQKFPAAGVWNTWGRPVLLAGFKQRLWFLAGGIEDKTSVVFNTIDGVNWQVVTNAAAFSPRGQAAGCVFADKLWLMGGQTQTAKASNEIWNSSDGKQWQQVTATSVWSARTNFACLACADKMWVMGGQAADGTLLNDVWNSTDGINWTQVSSAANWSARSEFGAAVFNGNLCIVAGKSASGVLADAWQSADGINWKGLSGNINWPPRSNPNVSVVGKALYVIGGVDQSGKTINDSNIYDTNNQWRLGIGPGWDNLVEENSAAFLGAIWFAGGNVNGVAYKDVWGFGPFQSS